MRSGLVASRPANVDKGSREDSLLCTYHQKRFSMMFRKMRLEHKRLPPSYTITDGLRWIGEYPWGGGGNADVWRGVYRSSKVAIKVLRANSRDLAGLQKVRPFASILFNERGVDVSVIGILSRSDHMEAIQTPELVTVGGRKSVSTKPDNGFRVDGTRYYHGLRHCVP